MRKILNNFAKWLYKKTAEEKPSPTTLLSGYKVMVSDFVPPDAVYMSSGKYQNMIDAFLHEEIVKLK